MTNIMNYISDWSSRVQLSKHQTHISSAVLGLVNDTETTGEKRKKMSARMNADRFKKHTISNSISDCKNFLIRKVLYESYSHMHVAVQFSCTTDAPWNDMLW